METEALMYVDVKKEDGRSKNIKILNDGGIKSKRSQS